MSGASTSIRMLRSFTAVLTVGLISCATVPVPTEQLAVAMLAISNAIDAGAAQYAGGDLKSAQEKMSNARGDDARGLCFSPLHG